MSFLVHVSSSESREIHAFTLDAHTGALSLIEVIDVPGSGAPTRGNIPLAWSRDGKILYAQVRIAPFPLSAFTVDPASGQSRLLQTVETPAPLAYLSLTRNGRFLLGASYDNAIVTVNRIGESGEIVAPCQQTVSTPPKAHCIVEAPFGDFVYVTSVDGEAILTYRLNDASGQLAPVAKAVTSTPSGCGPRHLVFHPTLDRLYCVNEHAGSVSVYSIDRHSGALTQLQYESLVPTDFSGRALGADLHLTPDGAFLYASVRKTNAIAVFRVDPAGGLLSNASTLEVEAYPRGFAIDPTGRFLLCAGQQSHHVAVYAIDPASGSLALSGRYPVGKRPGWIEIVAGGHAN